MRAAWSTDLRAWGAVAAASQFAIVLDQRPRVLPEAPDGLSILGQGLRRSYGDSCLNDGNAVLLTKYLDNLISWNSSTGVLRAEAGISLSGVLDFAVPHGWFLPVTPGTRFITLGGAVANDVHGKNHHRAGSFGKWVRRVELLRSNGQRLECARDENADLFRATVGGLGLTGLMTWIEIQMKPISGPWMHAEALRFSTIEEFIDIDAASMLDFEYTVAWVNMGDARGCGHYLRANHAEIPASHAPSEPGVQSIGIPFNCPEYLLSPAITRMLNELQYVRQFRKHVKAIRHYRPFFYPLDAISNWNRAYGSRGLYQYQFVVPSERFDAIKEVMRVIVRSRQGASLAVLKTFGPHASEGILSFPRPGVTLAVDIANRGPDTLRLFERLDGIVAAARGAIYPAKDGRMSARAFAASFPEQRDFATWIDARFSSSFWRRVTAS
jgi:FAD/FMN-containing dehydrogenase